jgi:plasmid stabilization system protein ParE
MAQLQWLEQAQADLREIASYQLQFTGQAGVARHIVKLANEIQKIADNPLIKGRSVEGKSIEYRRWPVLKDKYWVYFIRLSLREGEGIAVLRIYSTKRKPLAPDEIHL